MKKKWTLNRIPADYETLAREFLLDPVAIRVLVNRGYDTEEKIREFLSLEEAVFEKAEGLPDLEKAREEILRFRDEKKKVRVIGDYDIDGVCATAILLKAFAALGVDADYVIPHRVLDGYGLNTNLIEQAKENGIEAIITCDNGIAAFEAVELANSYGITVVVTDHHEVPEIIPNAVAVVDPKRKENAYANREICGAYVAYKVVCGLLGEPSGEEERRLRTELRILAGFATVGDVMPLNAENRSIVKFCLSHLKDGINLGLDALIHETDLWEKKLSSHSIGFILGPCINATGRIDSASNAHELLMCKEGNRARELAVLLKQMNEERKDLTAKGQEDAVHFVEETCKDDSVIVLLMPDIHESITGLVAGRVKEVFYRPTICFTVTEDGKIKGSGRSIEGYDMYEKLSACKDLFDKFGGHAMAAGITMPEENLETLRRKLNEEADLSEEVLTPELQIDADMPFAYVTEKLIHDLEKLEPYGVMNEKPVFARKGIEFVEGRIVGKNKDVGIFTVREPAYGDKTYKLKLFRKLDVFHEYLDQTFGEGTAEGLYRGKKVSLKIAYFPDLNEFQGHTNIEFILTDYE